MLAIRELGLDLIGVIMCIVILLVWLGSQIWTERKRRRH
jgi:hypothetical protein